MSNKTAIGLAAAFSAYKLGQLWWRGVQAQRAIRWAGDAMSFDVAAHAAAWGLVRDGVEPEWATRRMAEGYFRA